MNSELTELHDWAKDMIKREVMADQTELVEKLLDLSFENGVDLGLRLNGAALDPVLDESDKPFHYYLVSDWLRDKLSQRGEIIVAFEDDYWWGRRSTGQPTHIDDVILEIAADVKGLQ